MGLRIETNKWTGRDGEERESKKMKIQGKLMDEGEERELVCLVDKGLEIKTINYKDKETGEEKSFELGEIFSTEDNEEEEAFVANFTGQALREIRRISKDLGKGVHYTVKKTSFTNKKTGAVYPIVEISCSTITTTNNDNHGGGVEELVELKSSDDNNEYSYTSFEKTLINKVKEAGKGINDLMYNLKLYKEDGKDVKDLDEERFKKALGN